MDEKYNRRNFNPTDGEVEREFRAMMIREAIIDEDLRCYARNLGRALGSIKPQSPVRPTHRGCLDRTEAFMRDYVQGYYDLSDDEMEFVLRMRGEIDIEPEGFEGIDGEA